MAVDDFVEVLMAEGKALECEQGVSDRDKWVSWLRVEACGKRAIENGDNL